MKKNLDWLYMELIQHILNKQPIPDSLIKDIKNKYYSWKSLKARITDKYFDLSISLEHVKTNCLRFINHKILHRYYSFDYNDFGTGVYPYILRKQLIRFQKYMNKITVDEDFNNTINDILTGIEDMILENEDYEFWQKKHNFPVFPKYNAEKYDYIVNIVKSTKLNKRIQKDLIKRVNLEWICLEDDKRKLAKYSKEFDKVETEVYKWQDECIEKFHKELRNFWF